MHGAAWAANLLDLPHALLEHIASELASVRSVGRYACVCSVLRQLVAEHEPLWRVHLPSCEVTSHEPRLALCGLTTLAAARWTEDTARFSGDDLGIGQFLDGQPREQQAHSAFTCNDGKTLVVVGVRGPRASFLSAWAVDLSAQPTRWQEASPWSASDHVMDGTRPTARLFTADGGGGGVLHDRAGREWLCIFGGLIVDGNGRPRYRDNDTWLLGPLSDAAGCGQWRWWQVQDDGEAQSDSRPTTRFHHSQTVLRSGADARDALAVCGGNDYTMAPLLELQVVTLADVDLAAPAEGEEPGPPPSLADVCWDDQGLPPEEEVNVEEAEEEEEEEPLPRSRHAAVSWDGHGLIICGGEDVDIEDDEEDLTSEVWLCHGRPVTPDERRLQWVRLPDLPHKRSRAAAAVVKGEYLVVCGGIGDGDPAAVWVLPLRPLVDATRPQAARLPARGSGLRWAELSLPRGLESPRLDATLCVAHGDILVLGGGHSGEQLDSFGDAVGAFWAEGETCAWRLLVRGEGDDDDDGNDKEEGGDGAAASSISIARCRTCAAGLILEPIRRETTGGTGTPDDMGHLSPSAARLLLKHLQETPNPRMASQLRAQVRLVDSGEVGRCLGPPGFEAPYHVDVRLASDPDGQTARAVPLHNVRPRLVQSWYLRLGRVTVTSCASGVVAARSWSDSTLQASGMSARRLSFVP